MKVGHILRTIVAAALALTAVSCGDGPAAPQPGDTRPASELHFVRPAPGAPELADTTVQFLATKGVDSEIRIRYAVSPGSSETEEFVRFRVRPDALQAYPDGRPIAQGESVLITVRVVDFSRLIVQFEPSGLKFNPDRPAELTFKYNNTDHDFDGDGDIDSDDTRAESLLSIWRQEAAGEPWVKLSSKIEISLEEIEADITGFTGYALAY